MDAQRYVSIGDGHVYLVRMTPWTTIVALKDLIDHDESPIFSGNVRKIQFSGTENYTIVYER